LSQVRKAASGRLMARPRRQTSVSHHFQKIRIAEKTQRPISSTVAIAGRQCCS